MLYGHEFLGAAKYPKFAIKNLPAGRCGKTFSKEFGPSQNVLRGWAEKAVHPIIATNGLWRGGAHDYSGEKTLTEGLKELEKLIRIAEDFPKQDFCFTIFTEHRLKTKQLEKVFKEQWKLLHDTVLNIQLVNNPMSGGDILPIHAFNIPDLINEIHGTWNPRIAAPYMWGCDGLPAQDCDIQKFKDRHKNASVIWLWMQQYNCKKKVDESTPISQRKVKPIRKQVTSLEYLIPNKGNTKFHARSIYKTHADQHGDKPTGREQKPVIISPIDADKLEFMRANGKRVCVAKRAGNYTDGRPLYRCGIWGYEIQRKAVEERGNPITEVVAVKGSKRTSLGRVNPAFRENAYRLSFQHFPDEADEIIEYATEVSMDWV